MRLLRSGSSILLRRYNGFVYSTNKSWNVLAPTVGSAPLIGQASCKIEFDNDLLPRPCRMPPNSGPTDQMVSSVVLGVTVGNVAKVTRTERSALCFRLRNGRLHGSLGLASLTCFDTISKLGAWIEAPQLDCMSKPAILKLTSDQLRIEILGHLIQDLKLSECPSQ